MRRSWDRAGPSMLKDREQSVEAGGEGRNRGKGVGREGLSGYLKVRATKYGY